MSTCEAIPNFKVDEKTMAALERIDKKTKIGKLMGDAITAGVFYTLWKSGYEKKPSAPVYSIQSTDWDLYKQALSTIPDITKRAIQQEAGLMIIHYSKRENYDLKHAQFWRGIRSGCDQTPKSSP